VPRVRGAPPTCRGRAGQRRPAGTPGSGRCGTARPSRDGSGTSRGGTGSAARPAGPTRDVQPQAAAAPHRANRCRTLSEGPGGRAHWLLPSGAPIPAVEPTSGGGHRHRRTPSPGLLEPGWQLIGRIRYRRVSEHGIRPPTTRRSPGCRAHPSRQVEPETSRARPDTLVVSKPAGLGGSEKPPMTWIIVLLLILGTAAAVGLRIEARTWRDRPAEPSQAQQWRAMGGG